MSSLSVTETHCSLQSSYLCYITFLTLKQKLVTTFYLQTNGQTKKQNNILKAYLCAFVNKKQNDWIRLLLMVEFVYNNTKNTNIDHMPFELHCGYYPHIFFKDKVDSHLKSHSTNKLAKQLRELLSIYQQNLLHSQGLQNRAYNKSIKPCSYALGEKVWRNGKYIKIKQNWKLEAKFFSLFRVFHLIGKQVYKLELFTKWKIYDIFYISLLEQDTTRKWQVNELLELEPKLDVGEDKEYKVEAIKNNVVYAKATKDSLLGLYHLLF